MPFKIYNRIIRVPLSFFLSSFLFHFFLSIVALIFRIEIVLNTLFRRATFSHNAQSVLFCPEISLGKLNALLDVEIYMRSRAARYRHGSPTENKGIIDDSGGTGTFA